MKGLIIRTLHLTLFQVNELNNNKIISRIICDSEFETNCGSKSLGVSAITNKMANGVLSTWILPRRSLFSKCQIVSRNARKCNFMYVYKERKVLLSCTNLQEILKYSTAYMQKSNTNFYPHRAINEERRDRNLFTSLAPFPQIKCDNPCTNFRGTSSINLGKYLTMKFTQIL
jgi:hypothetical protein